MKPVVVHKKCVADIKVCTAKNSCPVNAIGFVRVKEPMLDKIITDKFDRCPLAAAGLAGTLAPPEGMEMKIGAVGTDDNPIPFGDPYIRVVIDYDKCNLCGLCVDACCGYAIDLVDDDVDIEEYNNSVTIPKTNSSGCGCSCNCG